MKLYEKLSALRKSHNYTQEQIAKKLCVTRQTVSKWEMGISEPSLDLLSKLADIYNCSIDELMGRDDPNNIAADKTVNNEQTENARSDRKPFWSINKEAFFVIIVGIIVTVVYFFAHHYYRLSITVFIAIECPIYIISTVITVCGDERIKTKKGLIGLIIPLVLVIVIQIIAGAINEH